MATKKVESLVLVGNGNGRVIIPSSSPLKRLNYFDGKFLRASDLQDEQTYLRNLVRLSNQAGGSGAVHGFDLTLGGGGTLNLGPGLGIDPEGRVLLLPQEVSMGVQELIDLSTKTQGTGKKNGNGGDGVFGDCVLVSDTPPVDQLFPTDLYLIVLFPADALCGEEDVYGKLCEEACATSTDRPYAIEGLIVRAVPLVLKTPLPQSKIISITSKLYLRSRVASAYFEDERHRVASMISKFGLAQQVWCLGAEAAGGKGLPIGVIAHSGGTTIFLDAWTARRERMDTPPRRYWQWRMMMRPWDVFMAQVLQFQCQLRDLFDGDFEPEPEDPCGDAKSVLGETAKKLADFLQAHKELSADAAYQSDLLKLESISQKLTATEQGMKVVAVGNRLLIQHGIISLPSAGYLPVTPNANTSVNEQVSKMMGEGVDLRFCVVRPDFVAHALEEAQHMERISLIEGLEDPKLKPEVDVLVPDGEITQNNVSLSGFDAMVTFLPDFAGDFVFGFARKVMNIEFSRVADLTIPFNGAARHATTESGAHKFYASMLFDDSFLGNMLRQFMSLMFGGAESKTEAAEPARAQEAKAEDATAEVKEKRLLARMKEMLGAKAQTQGTGNVKAQGGNAQVVADTGTIVPGGMWLEFNCDRDPTKLQTNDILHITGRSVIGAILPATIGTPSYMDVTPTINFIVDQAGSAGGQNFLNGRAEVTGSVITKFQGKDSDSGRVDLKVGLKWTSLGAGLGYQITAKITDADSGGHVTFEGKFGGPAKVIGGVVSSGDDSYVEFAFKPNPEVFKPANKRHQDALEAINIIGEALNSPSFVSIASANLFPPVPQTSDLVVRATRDWVLFHRRRNKNCGTPAVVVATRKYRVYQYIPSLGNFGRQNSEKIIPEQKPTKEQLEGVTAEDLSGFKPLGVVTFGGGVAALVGDTSAVQNAWQKIPGGKIRWGAIASSGDAVNDGDALAVSRLKNLESILDQVDPAARADVLPIVPPPVASADVDGVIFLVNAEDVIQTDLSLTKSALVAVGAAGRTITYDLLLTNNGPAPATAVTVTDPTPAGTTFLSATQSSGWTRSNPPIGSTGNVEFSKAVVADGEVGKLQIVVLVSPNLTGGTIDNIATVSSETLDSNLSNNTVKISTPITAGTPAPVTTQRTALVVFMGAEGKVATNSPGAKVIFQNNLSQGNALKDAVAKIVADEEVVQLRIAAIGAIDSTALAQQRQNEVLKELKARSARLSPNLTKPIDTLKDAEKPALGLTSAQLAGVQEVIVLMLGAFKP